MPARTPCSASRSRSRISSRRLQCSRPSAGGACRLNGMSTTSVLDAAEYESRLQQYYFERAEEGRAVRVGEKEVSEQAAIVARYRDLFTRPQIEALLEAEQSASGDEHERLYRLRKTCESGVIAAELVEQEDA